MAHPKASQANSLMAMGSGARPMTTAARPPRPIPNRHGGREIRPLRAADMAAPPNSAVVGPESARTTASSAANVPKSSGDSRRPIAALNA